MSITAKDLSWLASGLVRGRLNYDNEEALLRTAINRSYYSVYLVTRDFVRLRGTHNAHTRVRGIISQYRGCGEKIAEKLEELSGLRRKADYNLDADISREDAARGEQLMEEILDLIDQMKKNPGFQVIQDGVSMKRAAQTERRSSRRKKREEPADSTD